MASKKPKSKLNKKERAEYERKREKAELLKNYKEGVSNIDYDNLPLYIKIEMISEFTVADLEKTLGYKIPLISKTEWLKREMAKLDENRLKVPPSYKLQDPVDEMAKYRQKFVENMRELKPEILEELRRYAEKFESLFGHTDGYRFLYKLQDVRYKLIMPNSSFVDTSNLQDQSFNWGRFIRLFLFLSAYDFYCNQNNKLENLPDVRQIIESRKYDFQSAEKIIIETFEEKANDKNKILRDFLDLQLGILDWCKTYNLERDWLFEYAYYFIKQFSDNNDIKIKDLNVEKRFYDPKLQFFDLKFSSHGWNASPDGENVSEFRKRVTKDFEKALNLYLSEATEHLELNNFKKFIKPPTYKSVSWFAYMFFRNFDAEKVVEKYFLNISANRNNSASDRKRFENKIKHVNNEVAKLKQYGFPEINK